MGVKAALSRWWYRGVVDRSIKKNCLLYIIEYKYNKLTIQNIYQQ